jgi:hypothetical protein
VRITILVYFTRKKLYINCRPKNKEELFNLRHSSARNVIERIFGVLKRRFRVLLLAPEYSMDIQARIPAALCTIHNFISIHDPTEKVILADDDDDDAPAGDAPAAPAIAVDEPSVRRDQIAQEMWEDYTMRRTIGDAEVHNNDEEDEEDGSEE